MRVEGPTSAQPREVRRKPTAEGASSGFRVDSGGEAARAEGVAAAPPLTSLDTLFVLQEVPGDRDSRRRALKRATDMLDSLDAIRLDLLDGAVPIPRLEALLRLVRSQRDQVSDPRLEHLLDEIELRARVELAKLGQPCQ
jgi:Class II flagellar assembly regulator